MKRVTRKQARAWLDPMRRCFAEMRSGFVTAIDGRAVTRLHEGDDGWARVDYCIAGFVGLIGRLSPKLGIDNMLAIWSKLEADQLVTQAELDGALREIRRAEDVLVKMTVKDLASVVTTEQIAIELEALMRDAA